MSLRGVVKLNSRLDFRLILLIDRLGKPTERRVAESVKTDVLSADEEGIHLWLLNKQYI